MIPRSIRVDCLLKICGAHFRLGLDADERVDLLIAHYAALRRAMHPDVLTRFLAGAPLRLAELPGDGAEIYELLLLRVPFNYRYEGEATLSLRSRATGVRLADVSFVIGGTGGVASYLRIGGAQGPPAPDGKAAVKAATKALDGLRPKAVVIEAIYRVAQGFGVASIRATALSHHAMRGTPFARMIHAGPYDLFWEELGAQRLPEGDYLLPARPPHREAADVPGKRRREWERRQRRVAELTDQIAATVAAFGARPAPPARDWRPALREAPASAD